MKALLLAVAVSSVLLSGCASLSESDCAVADWEQIGYRDGAAGGSERRLGEHAKACAEYGVVVDTDTWRAGYDQGIDAYCTPQNAVRTGLAGGHYSGVCPGEAGVVFDNYYRAAREVQAQRQYVASLEQQRRSLRNALEDTEVDEERRSLRRQLRRLDADLYNERNRLGYAESRLFR